jgi:hypothetical protein
MILEHHEKRCVFFQKLLGLVVKANPRLLGMDWRPDPMLLGMDRLPDLMLLDLAQLLDPRHLKYSLYFLFFFLQLKKNIINSLWSADQYASIKIIT